MNSAIKNIISKLSLEEKVLLVTGADGFSTASVERLGIEKMEMHDSPFGVRVIKEKDKAAENTVFLNTANRTEEVSTAFPTGCAMGATFDRDLVAETGKALGEEAAYYGLSVILGPSMNIKRNPLCGRNFEYFSEDPCLTGELAAAYVNGVQTTGVAACPKHYIANNQERGRYHISSEMDERTMREMYLSAFEKMIQKSDPMSIMTAYNRINGIYASECKYLLEDILRKEWGFDGAVISDWGGVKNRANSVKAGVDIAMPYAPEHSQSLLNALSNGSVSITDLDKAVYNVLNLYFRTRDAICSKIDFQAHYRTAYKIACAAMTLLKNNNSALPLNCASVKNLLIIGEAAKSPNIGGCGSSKIQNPYTVDIPFEKIMDYLPDSATVEYIGKDELNPKTSDIGPIEGKILEKSKKADAVIIFASQNADSASEAIDRNSIELSPIYEHAIRLAHCANKRVIVILNVGAAVRTAAFENCADAILVSWLGGEAMGSAIADTIFGKNNPSGRIAETFCRDIYDFESVKHYSYDMTRTVYKEGVFVGYRQFERDGIKPQYPFGHGLSYTEFKYSGLKYSVNANNLLVSLDIENTGKSGGHEVVQLYIAPPETTMLERAEKELKDFTRIFLNAGQAKRISFVVPMHDIMYYNPMLRKFVNDTGIHRIMVGASSADIRAVAEFELKKKTDYTEFPGGE